MTFYELLKGIITKLGLAVRIDAQTLTEEQKAQARTNIDAASPEYINEQVANVAKPSDYSQNDETAVDYIKNRTHWIETILNIDETLMEERVLSTNSSGYVYLRPAECSIIQNTTYRICYNGVDYVLKSSPTVPNGSAMLTAIGNFSLYNSSAEDTGEPFCVVYMVSNSNSDSANYIYTNEKNADITLSIYKIDVQEQVHRIDGKFLPEGGFGYEGSGEPIDIAWFVEGQQDGGVTIWYALAITPLVEGNTYNIITDSGTYNAVCKVIEMDGQSGYAIGNVGALMGDESLVTDDSFMFISGAEGSEQITMAADFNGGSTFIISEGQTIHKIDPKFLPEGGFGYEDIATVFDDVITFSNNQAQDFYPISLKEGETYTIIVNDEEYKGVCKSAIVENTSDVLYIGNGYPIGAENTGEKFMFAYVASELSYRFDYEVADGDYQVVIKGGTEVHHIDNKFLNFITKDTLTLTFDGNIAGADCITLGDTAYAIKMLDTAIDVNGLESISMCSGGEIQTVKNTDPDWDEWMAETFEIIPNLWIVAFCILVATADIEYFGVKFKKGTYFQYVTDENGVVQYYVSEVCALVDKINTQFLPKISPELLPEGGFGYTEEENTIIQPEITETFVYDPTAFGVGLSCIVKENVSYGISIGDIATVIWDGNSYECEALDDGNGMWNIGNPKLVGAPEEFWSTEPFLFMHMGAGAIYIADTEGEHTFSIFKQTETVHAINPKYFPEGGVGYTEDGVLTHDGNYNGKVTFTESVYRYVRVGDSINFNDIVKVVVYYEGEQRVVLREYMEITEDENGNIVAKAVGLNGFYILTDTNAYNVPSGTYVVSNNDEFSLYVMQIETETVHKIEKKYLPDDFMECAVIDLSECVNSSFGATVEQIFFMMFQNGGGTYPSAFNQGKLWETLDTFGNRPIKVVIHTDLMGVTGGTIETTRVNLMRVNGGQVHQLSFECSVVDPSSGISVNVLCVLTYTGNDKGTISVKVEPLEFP